MLKDRSPVVVVLGHVDHGKTTLLDYIRKTNRVGSEIGAITQTIGAYEAHVNIKGSDVNKITFIDTPGHEAFTKLRVRGADVADIAILIVDAVDSVMPQTVESIYHIKNAKIPFIVAVNKTDLEGANINRVKSDLMKEEILFEGAGGETPLVEISAKTGKGIDHLLETILFMASLKELKYSPENPTKAYIIEAKKDKLGIMASAIIKDGRLKVGEDIYAGTNKARIKALINDEGKNVDEVLPSAPFLILGFKDLPEVGIPISKQKIEKIEAVQDAPPVDKKMDMAAFFSDEKKKRLRIILKTDSQGSLDAVLSVLAKNENIELSLAGVGEISKSDIFLAKVTAAIIIGFGVSPDKSVADLAETEKIVIKTYSLIYQLLDELTEVSNLLAEKEQKEKQVKGEAKILASFIIEKEKIAGIKVIKGKINLNDQIELYRDNKLKSHAKVVSLKSRSKNIGEIKKNEEGGMIFYPQLDFNIGDVVKSYSI